MLKLCGGRKCGSYIGQPYLLRLYCITDTFSSTALIQHLLEAVKSLKMEAVRSSETSEHLVIHNAETQKKKKDDHHLNSHHHEILKTYVSQIT
jgi:hypothetical protein